MTVHWSAGPVELPGAVRYTLTTGDDPTDRWHVDVAVPPATSRQDPIPVLYVLDGFLTFLTTAQIAQNTLAFSLGQLRPVAVVGISPATDDRTHLFTRRPRDLTPTVAAPGYHRGETPHGTGRASAMLDLIHEVIAPHVEAAHRLDPSDRGIAGFSLGGLFTCWTLVCRPEGFRRFLAVSPSLWWDDRLLLAPHRARFADREASDVYLAVGEREDSPDRSWPVMPAAMRRSLSGLDMVADLSAFTERLRAQEKIDVRSEVIPDEQHATIWPTAVTRGLLHLYQTTPP
ncbi:alpha/beta hydrolase [Actinomadura welshii]|uniref:alpha/beta hydrolase n=1 Tax=Actinomadura welshii TaxID=3103817 RepID=UPI0003ACE53E|nr:alpha/beta hydrolase-fold protein [Actinomadura madurae]